MIWLIYAKWGNGQRGVAVRESVEDQYHSRNSGSFY